MIRNSEKTQELFNSLVEEYDDFWSYALEELEGITIEGSDYANQVFSQLEYSETWTYFWTGDNYILFPFTEEEVVKRLKAAEKTFLSEEEDGPESESMSMLERLNRG